jgi:predicted metal-dependent phosphoesterase TrpH
MIGGVRIDLHAHSDMSDGTEPPGQVVRRAAEAGVDILALTDHDGTGGWDEAEAALPSGMTLVPGVELSCVHRGRSLHLLGYLFDPAHPELAAEMERLRTDRVRRARGMVDRLNELGAPVAWEEVQALAGGETVGRPHIARAMVAAGVVPSFEDAFTTEWIGEGGRAHVSRYALDPLKAVRLVTAAGGVSVFAHPLGRGGYTFGDDLIAEMAGAGLGGAEVDHPDHTPEDRARLRKLAEELDLVVTGSSDDHGELTGHRLGCETTSPEQYERLCARAGR